jgi:hypothetical protein
MDFGIEKCWTLGGRFLVRDECSVRLADEDKIAMR